MAPDRQVDTVVETIYIMIGLIGTVVLVVLCCCCRRSTRRGGEVLPPVRAAYASQAEPEAEHYSQHYCRTVTVTAVPTAGGHGGAGPPYLVARGPHSAAPYSAAGPGIMPHPYSSAAPDPFNTHAPPPSYEQAMREPRSPSLPYSHIK